VLDPLENLFPMHRDIPRRINSDSNLRVIHAKDRHDDVRSDPDDFANSPREYQHIRFLACLETASIPAILFVGPGHSSASLRTAACNRAERPSGRPRARKG
jgi:hypothetical protein